MNVRNHGIIAAAVLAFPLLHVNGLGITDMPNNPLVSSSGQELMSALDVPEGDENLSFSSWSYPTSVVIRTIPYRVDVQWLESGCKVYSTNDFFQPLADIYVVRLPNEKIARIYKFGNTALGCSRMTESLARGLSVEYLDQTTNTLFVSYKRYDPRLENFLISKNIIVGIRCATNALDFAVAILNAGLPENERITITPEGE